jgi:hypothetical protein
MTKPVKIKVTVKSEGAVRPSEHKLSPEFSGGIDYTETFSCDHSRQHANLLMRMLDLTAEKCGIDTGEFAADNYFTKTMNNLIRQIEHLHSYVMEKEKHGRTRPSLEKWTS